MANILICDFCSSTKIKWRLLATTDSITTDVDGLKVEHISVGDWAACDDCMSLILENDKDGLAERSYRQFVEKYGPVPKWVAKEMRAGLKEIQALFWRNYTGLYEPHTGSEE